MAEAKSVAESGVVDSKGSCTLYQDAGKRVTAIMNLDRGSCKACSTMRWGLIVLLYVHAHSVS